MQRGFLLLLLLLSASPTGQAAQTKRYALLAGGSGEEEKKNFFLEDLSDFRKQLSGRGWDVSVVAGPGNATNAAIESALKKTLARAESGEEVLVLFHSHGKARDEDWGQKTHSIVSEDRDASGTAIGFDLDRTSKVIQDASARGVRVAVVDLSCYSGNTQALAGPACIVTLAAASYISLCSGRPEERHFSSKFFKLPAPGSAATLESQFLSARREDRDSINLPQISSRTTPGQKTWETFLREADPLDVSEDLYYLAERPTFDPERLLASAESPELKRTIQKALKIRGQLEKKATRLSSDYNERTVVFTLPQSGKLELSPSSFAELIERAGQSKPDLEGWTDVQRRRLDQFREVQGKIAKLEGPQLNSFRKRKTEFDRLSDELADASSEAMAMERKLYDRDSKPSERPGCAQFDL